MSPVGAAPDGSRAYVFLDRDGTLVADDGYVHRIEDYALLAGVPQALCRLQVAGFRLAIVTNQSGIGRGYYGVEEFERFQARLLEDLTPHGIHIDATFYCPHRPTDGCGCRKPATGLLERAQRALGADLARSWVVGDAASDVELAQRAGCRSVWLRGERDSGVQAAATFEARDLPEAVDLILRAHRS